MLNKILSVSVMFLLLNLAIAPSVWAFGNAEKEARLTEKVKIGIVKLGVGKEAKVKLKLKDGTKFKGYVSEIGDEQFVVQNEKTGESVVVSYHQVRQVKGNNLSSGAIITIGAIALVALIVILLVVQKDNT